MSCAFSLCHNRTSASPNPTTIHPIRLPKEKTKHKSEQDAPKLRVNGVWYRKLLDVIVTAYQDPSAQHFNYIPYKLFCQKSTIFGGPESEDSEEPEDCAPPLEADLERIYTEVWTCDAMLEEDLKIRAQPRNPDDDDNVEYAIAPLMLWSDSTHLANFGTASLWPIYMYFASLTKYLRSKVSSFAAHHLAYLPLLPDTIQDHYRGIYGIPATKHVLRFCKNQLMHAVWLLLLDDKFMEAYEHGIRVSCADGIIRRLFPRFFTYSADYPERILLACIRFLAECPCPTCLIKKAQVAKMGTKMDCKRRENIRQDTEAVQSRIARARKLIFEHGTPIHK